MNSPQTPIRRKVARHQNTRLDREEFVQLLRRNIWLILLTVAVSVGGTYYYLSRQAPLYSAQSAMALTNSEVRISQVSTQMEVYDLTRARVETELDRLKSRNFAEDLAKSLDLFDDTTFLPVADDGPELGSVERARAVIDMVQAAYYVERSGESLVITILAEANSPELAAQIANGVVETFVNDSVNRQMETFERSTSYLKQQVDTLGEQLTVDQMKLAEFIRENVLDDAELPESLRRERSQTASVLEVMNSRNEGNTAERRRLEANLADVEAQLLERTRSELQLSRMERGIGLLETRYQTLVERLNQLEPQRNQIQPDARQITVAEVPFEPSWPNIPTSLAFAIPAGLILGFILALLRSSMNRQIWNGAQASYASQLPNLGNLPRIPGRGFLWRRHRPIEYLLNNPRSEYREAMRSLLTIWTSQGNDNRAPRVAMITSALPNEGKSTVATSMAAVASLEDQKVILLDFDTQRAGASKIIGDHVQAHSISSLLDGSISVEDAVTEVEHLESLHFIRFNQKDRLTQQFVAEINRKLLPKLISSYDLIVLDTPPVLGVADAARLGALADEALIVVRAGKTPENALRSSIERLEDSGVKLAGTVINDVNQRHFRQMNLGGSYGYY